MSDITRDYSFGGWLKSFRLKRKLTLRKVAELSGLDAGNWSKLELSRLNPPTSMSRLKSIVGCLDLEATEWELLISAAYNFHLANFRERFKK